MHLIPAVDILDGAVVRLVKGDYGAVTAYESSPTSAVTAWADQGAALVHVVDLEGARSGKPTVGLSAQIAATGVPFQMGGGIRSVESAARVLESGAERVVLGSVAVWEPDLLTSLVDRFGGGRVVAAVDVKAGRATGAGWLDEGRPYAEVIAEVAATGAGWILTTGIASDGTMAGPDLELTRSAVELAPQCGVIGSGGVGTLADVVAVAECGAKAVIVGKALYEGRFTLAEAIAAVA